MSDTHRCLADAACRRATTIDDQRVGAPTEKPDTLCPPCATHISSAIKQLPRDWAELRDTLGERSAANQMKIRSTPSPAMPISARKEALMAQILEAADRAAAVVSCALNADQPDGRRRPAIVTVQDDETGQQKQLIPLPGTPAFNAAEAVKPASGQLLSAAVNMVEPNIDLLVSTPPDTAQVWKTPSRCDFHAEMVEDAEMALAAELCMPDVDKAGVKKIRSFLRDRLRESSPFRKRPRPLMRQARELLDVMNTAHRAAGACDDCAGIGEDGWQAREFVELSGMDIALQLVELHHQTRAELGLTRLRHRYPMPCPRCGGRVGRDDGETIITCDDRENCRSSWTEREYQFLAGLITRERLDMEIAKWLLAEAYARLDDAQRRLDAITDTDTATLELPGAGQIVVEAIRQAIDGHKPPKERTITSDRKATTERQTSEDTWQWGDQPRTYRPPKRKPRPQTKPVENPIHPGSLTTLIDVDEDAAINGRIACTECNMTHAGDCP